MRSATIILFKLFYLGEQQSIPQGMFIPRFLSIPHSEMFPYYFGRRVSRSYSSKMEEPDEKMFRNILTRYVEFLIKNGKTASNRDHFKAVANSLISATTVSTIQVQLV